MVQDTNFPFEKKSVMGYIITKAIWHRACSSHRMCMHISLPQHVALHKWTACVITERQHFFPRIASCLSTSYFIITPTDPTAGNTLIHATRQQITTIISYINVSNYHQTANISRALVGHKIVDHLDVVGASPVGAAPSTSSFLALHRALMGLGRDNCKTRREILK